MEQWHMARAQTPPDSPPSSDTLRQVVISRLEGLECGDANTLHLHFKKLHLHLIAEFAYHNSPETYFKSYLPVKY